MLEIKTEKISERRNEIMAEMFHKVHFGERWGRGIKLILSKEPETNFRDNADGFVSIFKRQIAERGGQINEGLSEGLKLTVNAIINPPNIKAKEIAELTKRPVKTIERQIKQLISLEKIERRGSRKTGGYFIKNEK